MIVPFMRICLGNTECKKRKWEEFEAIFERGAIGDFWEEWVLLASFLVGGRLNGSEGTFN